MTGVETEVGGVRDRSAAHRGDGRRLGMRCEAAVAERATLLRSPAPQPACVVARARPARIAGDLRDVRELRAVFAQHARRDIATARRAVAELAAVGAVAVLAPAPRGAVRADRTRIDLPGGDRRRIRDKRTGRVAHLHRRRDGDRRLAGIAELAIAVAAGAPDRAVVFEVAAVRDAVRDIDDALLARAAGAERVVATRGAGRAARAADAAASGAAVDLTDALAAEAIARVRLVAIAVGTRRIWKRAVTVGLARALRAAEDALRVGGAHVRGMLAAANQG